MQRALHRTSGHPAELKSDNRSSGKASAIDALPSVRRSPCPDDASTRWPHSGSFALPAPGVRQELQRFIQRGYRTQGCLILLAYRNRGQSQCCIVHGESSLCSWFAHFLDSLAKVGEIAEMKVPPESGGWCMIPLAGAMHQSMRFWQNHGEFGLSLRRY